MNRDEENQTGWPYDVRPLADQGASEAKYDAQGTLVALPKKEQNLADYERLLDGLYQAAKVIAAAKNQSEHGLTKEMVVEFFCAALGFFDPVAALQISKGIRDGGYARTAANRKTAHT